MERIVVAYDGSQTAAAALGWAVGEARLHGVEAVACTVLDRNPARPFGERTRDPAAQFRQVIEQISGRDGIDHRILYGHPAAELARVCTETDLLVVGSRGRNPMAGLLLGSVSRSLLHCASCPVAVVRRAPPDPLRRRVVVGVTASDPSRRALRLAEEEAMLRGAALHAVHAVHWDPLGAEMVVPTDQELTDWGNRLLDTELAESGVRAQPVVVVGHAPDVLVRQSVHADLLVLGARGTNPLTGLLLGSTSDHSVRYAGCPVLIVR
jgi:nucleotide-binding universal stress UspA family protein